MSYEFKIRRHVEFSETDMAGIVHYSNFFKYMESAEHGFYRALGHSVTAVSNMDPPLGWPRVHAACDFKKPLRFEDEVEIHLLVQRVGARSLTFLFRLSRVGPGPVEEVARGRVSVACVTHAPDGSLKPVPIPPGIREKIRAAPAELLA
jgi:acyl-CoA thioester hydrolase